MLNLRNIQLRYLLALTVRLFCYIFITIVNFIQNINSLLRDTLILKYARMKSIYYLT